ncbi:MAG TPA: zf-TFIIB domain-containing protein [Armatimonadota bacterium]|nr:zf-TFIIB domain-containing protein [Armatimonadota bacterium]
MTCPACNQAMISQDFDGVMVDVCANCKGLWFDWQELARLEKPTSQITPALQSALDSPRQPDQNRGALRCPKCGIPLHRHEFRMEQGVDIDECYQCGGFFLDAGELKAIRDTNMTPAEHTAYCEKLINNLPEVHQVNMEIARQEQRAGALRNWSHMLMRGPRWWL